MIHQHPDGDGWTTCAAGHRHWGRFGAAGLLLHAEGTVLLQHRAEWTHEGGTWGIPGGARGSREDAVSAALREAGEEAGIDGADVRPLGLAVEDHGGWSYTTVLAVSTAGRLATEPNHESAELRWVRHDEVTVLPLHPGFARSWARLGDQVHPLTVVVDGANVVGSRPDGWWHDRLAAARRLRERLAPLGQHGLPAALAGSPGESPLDVVLPRVLLVVEGQARPVVDEPGEVAIVSSRGEGDDEVVAQVAAAVGQGEDTVVVTADRGLRERVAQAGGRSVGPGQLQGWLDGGGRPTP